MVSPLGRVPERALDWFFVAIEACGGETSDLGYFLGVSVFIGIFGVGFTLGGSLSRPRDRGRALHPRGPLVAPLTDFFRLYITIYPKTSGNRIDREFRRRKPL